MPSGHTKRLAWLLQSFAAPASGGSGKSSRGSWSALTTGRHGPRLPSSVPPKATPLRPAECAFGNWLIGYKPQLAKALGGKRACLLALGTCPLSLQVLSYILVPPELATFSCSGVPPALLPPGAALPGSGKGATPGDTLLSPGGTWKELLKERRLPSGGASGQMQVCA